MTELAVVHSLSNLPVSKHATTDALAQVSSQSSFLPYLQLYAGTAKAVQTGKMTKGHFGIVRGDNIEDLGKEFDCYPMSMRFKALRFGENLVISYDPNDPIYQKIYEESNVKGQTGAMCGMEFLIYLPVQETYVLYHMSNNSSRVQAPNMMVQVGKPTTVTSKLVHNKKQQYWDVPEISACQTPLDEPDMVKASEMINLFLNPKEPEVKAASADEVAAAGRAR